MLKVSGGDFNQAETTLSSKLVKNPSNRFYLRKCYWKEPIVEAVVIKNVRKTGRDDTPDAKIFERPNGVLSTRAAAKICATK